MDAPLYVLENLRKSYSGRDVVDLEHLEVQWGEVLALVGPSRTGKSTLLRLLNFLEPPTAGTIAYCGRTYGDRRVPVAIRREITTVFQRPVLIRGSVRRNVAYGLRLRGRRDDRRVAQMLTRVGLDALAKVQAERLATRVGLMLSGRLIEISTPQQFFETPADARTAAFVRGEMVC